MPHIVKPELLPGFQNHPRLDCRRPQMISREHIPTRDVLPCVLGDAKTQSVGLPYAVVSCHSLST